MDASCWVARKIFLSPAIASSRARTLDSRPTTKGVIMNGNMTTSRMGIIGKRFVSDFSLEVSILRADCRSCGTGIRACVVFSNKSTQAISLCYVVLAGFFEQRQTDLLGQHHFFGDLELADLLIRRDVIHQ